MRFLQLLITVILMTCALAPRGMAQSFDPQEAFMKAFMAGRQAEELEKEGKLKGALTKFRFAGSLLDQIRAQNPQWQPIVVEYRTRRIHESLERVEKKIAMENVIETTPETTNRQPLTDVDLPPVQDIPLRATRVNDDPLPANADELPPLPEIEGMNNSKLKKLQEDIKKLQTELATTKKENKDLAKKLDAAGEEAAEFKKTAAVLKEKLTKSEGQLKTIGDDVESRKTLKREIESMREKLAEAEKQVEQTAKKNKELTTQLTDAKQLAETAVSERDAAMKSNDDLAAQLADAKTNLTALSTQRDEAIKERDAMLKARDEALAQAAGAKETAEKIDALVAENSQLTQKLTSTEEKIKTITADDQSVPAIKAELVQVKEELDAAKKQSQNYDATMAQLRQELDSAAVELDKAKISGTKSTEDSTKMTAENELLREIIFRELREQARRNQAKKLAMEEISKLETRSQVLEEQLDVLSQPVVRLTPEELALFRRPNMDLASDDTAPVEIIMALPPSEAGQAIKLTTETSKPLTELTAEDISSPGQITGTTTPDAGVGNSPSVKTQTPPKVPEALLPLANEAAEFFQRGKYRDAENSYKKILAKEPKNLHALYNLGVVYFKSNKLSSSEVTFKKAIAAAPKDSLSHSMLGIVYYTLGKYDDSIEFLTKAITLDPQNAAAHNYLGITASQKGWQDAAEEELQKAIQINPKYADAHFNLAVIYATSTPPSKELARRHYKMATEYGAMPDNSLEALLQ